MNKSTFEYQDNDLVKQNNPTGNSYSYTYDSKHNLLTALSENNVKYSFSYDVFGNPLTMSQSDSEGDLSINSSATYTPDGNYLKTLTDSRGNTSAYVYNTSMGPLAYFVNVGVPSLTLNILRRTGNLNYDYYGAPWDFS